MVPKHLTAERVIKIAITMFHRTPGLQECSVESVLGCVIQAAELGLELSGPLGQAYMVPYRNKHTQRKEAQFQIGYRGLQDLAYRSGRVDCFPAHVVYENDTFDYAYGTKPFLTHKPTMGDPGAMKAFYAVLMLKGGANDFEVMSLAAVEAHRDRYSKGADRNDSAWKTAFEEMAKKTVIRKLAKRAPLSTELRAAATLDEYGEAGLPQNLALNFQGQQVIEAAPAPGRSSLKNGNGATLDALPQTPIKLSPLAAPVQEPEAQASDTSTDAGPGSPDGAPGFGDEVQEMLGQCNSKADLTRLEEWIKTNRSNVSDEQYKQATALIVEAKKSYETVGAGKPRF